MKRNFVLLMFMALCPAYAFGDYVPGRTRASAKADLRADQGSGRYEEVRGAHLVQFTTDGKGFTTLQLQLDNGRSLNFKIGQIRPSRCGQVFRAAHQDQSSRSALQLDELAPFRCRQPGPQTWRVQLTTETAGEPGASSLILYGTPEYIMLSQ